MSCRDIFLTKGAEKKSRRAEENRAQTSKERRHAERGSGGSEAAGPAAFESGFVPPHLLAAQERRFSALTHEEGALHQPHSPEQKERKKALNRAPI